MMVTEPSERRVNGQTQNVLAEVKKVKETILIESQETTALAIHQSKEILAQLKRVIAEQIRDVIVNIKDAIKDSEARINFRENSEVRLRADEIVITSSFEMDFEKDK